MEQLIRENAEDLDEARRIGHRLWVSTLTRRRDALELLAQRMHLRTVILNERPVLTEAA